MNVSSRQLAKSKFIRIKNRKERWKIPRRQKKNKEKSFIIIWGHSSAFAKSSLCNYLNNTSYNDKILLVPSP